MKISSVEFSAFNFSARKQKPVGFSLQENMDLFEYNAKNKTELINDINRGKNIDENVVSLTKKYIPYILNYASELKKTNPDINTDDVIQEGVCYLYETLNNKKENKLLNQNGLISAIRKRMDSYAKKEQALLNLSVPLSKVDEEYKSTDVFDVVQRNTITTYIRQIVECINGKQREALAERFDLSGGKEQSFDEVGQKLGISKDNAKQSSANALRRVQKMPETLKMKPLLDSIEAGYDEVKNLTLPLQF